MGRAEREGREGGKEGGRNLVEGICWRFEGVVDESTGSVISRASRRRVEFVDIGGGWVAHGLPSVVDGWESKGHKRCMNERKHGGGVKHAHLLETFLPSLKQLCRPLPCFGALLWGGGEYRLLESGIAAGGAGAVKQAYLTCLGLFTVVTLKTAIENQYFYAVINLGTGMRGVLSTVRRCCCDEDGWW